MLERIRVLFRLAAAWRDSWLAFAGASVYWAGDVACLWASPRPVRSHAEPCLRSCSHTPSATYSRAGRCLSRAPESSRYCCSSRSFAAGAPFSGAILGVFTYRLFDLWLPMIPAVIAPPTVPRRFGFGGDAFSRVTTGAGPALAENCAG